MTDGTGAIAWAADYLPFGQADVTVASVENNLRFSGQYYDSETGLHYNYYRYYDPKLGRYLRADPDGLEAGVNLYVYTQNNPINAIDPWGLFDLLGFIYGVEHHPEYPGTVDGCTQYCNDRGLDFESFVTVGENGEGVCRCKEKDCPTEDERRNYQPDKPNRKKQGREPGEKKRQKPGWKPRNPPKEPPRHTPSRKN